MANSTVVSPAKSIHSNQNITPSNSTVPSSSTNSAITSSNPLTSRRRNSNVTTSSNTSSNPLTNTTVNPLASLFSGNIRLPSSVVAGAMPQTNRRLSAGVSNRRTSNSNNSINDGGSSDALLEVNEGRLENRRSNANLSSNIGSESGASEDSNSTSGSTTRQWNNISSVVQSISPLLPSTMAFQLAARRVMGSQNVGRMTGNRLMTGLSNSTSVDTGTAVRDDLRGLLTAMEESTDEADKAGKDSSGADKPTRGGAGSRRRSTDASVATTSSCAAGSDRESGDHGESSGGASRLSGDNCSIPSTSSNCQASTSKQHATDASNTNDNSFATTSAPVIVPDIDTGESNANVSVDFKDGKQNLTKTGTIPKTKTKSLKTGKKVTESLNVSDSRNLFSSLLNSLMSGGSSTKNDTKKVKSDNNNAGSVSINIDNVDSSDDTSRKNKLDSALCVASTSKGVSGVDTNNKADIGDTTDDINTDTNGGGDSSADNAAAAAAAGASAAGDGAAAVSAGSVAETDDGNSDDTENEDGNSDDPYWYSILWQLPVLLLVLLAKFLLHYWQALGEVMMIVLVFHGANVVIKRNVVSNRTITLGWKKCSIKLFETWKKKLHCRRRNRTSDTANRVGGATVSEVANEEAGTSTGGGATSDEAANPEAGTNTGGAATSDEAANPEAGTNTGGGGSGSDRSCNVNENTADRNTHLESATVSENMKEGSNSENKIGEVSKLDTDENNTDDSNIAVASAINVTTPSPNESSPEKIDAERGIKFIDVGGENDGAEGANKSKEIGVHFQKSPIIGSIVANFTDVKLDENVAKSSSTDLLCSYVSTDGSDTKNDNVNKSDSDGTADQASNNTEHKADYISITVTSDDEVAQTASTITPNNTTPTTRIEAVNTSNINTPTSNITSLSNVNTNTSNFEAAIESTNTTTTTVPDGDHSNTDVSIAINPVMLNDTQDNLLSYSEEEQQAQESVQCVQERVQLLMMTVVVIPLVVFVFYVFLWKTEAVYWSLVFMPPPVPPVLLTQVLWLCLVLDYLARLSTVWVKGCLCLLLMCRSSTSILNKGKLYPLLEMISQLYRSLLPIHPWFVYIYGSYDDYSAAPPASAPDEFYHTTHWGQPIILKIDSTDVTTAAAAADVSAASVTTVASVITTVAASVSTSSGFTAQQLFGSALFVAYLLHKRLDLVTRGSNLWQAIRTLRTNTGSYGTAPSKSELESSGGKCPICHDQYKVPTLLQCSHIFCESCIVQWFQRERICPMCRAQIADDPMWKDGATSQLPQII